MSSHHQILYHLVISTKMRLPSITSKHREELYMHIWKVIRRLDCMMYKMNGTEDHIHILCDLHPSISLNNLIHEIKTSSSLWIKESGKMPLFEGWELGYAAFTHAYKDKEAIMKHIQNQDKHHAKLSFQEEYKLLLEEHEIVLNGIYF